MKGRTDFLPLCGWYGRRKSAGAGNGAGFCALVVLEKMKTGIGTYNIYTGKTSEEPEIEAKPRFGQEAGQ